LLLLRLLLLLLLLLVFEATARRTCLHQEVLDFSGNKRPTTSQILQHKGRQRYRTASLRLAKVGTCRSHDVVGAQDSHNLISQLLDRKRVLV